MVVLQALTALKRTLLSFICFLGIELPLQLIGMIVLLPLCAFYDIGKLPRVFRYFDSADPFVGRDTSVIDLLNTVPALSPYYVINPYWTKYNWLAIRNPLNYFQYSVLGFQFTGKEQMSISGDPNVGDNTGKVPGFKHIEMDDGHYEYLLVKRIGQKACIYIRIGHKIGKDDNKAGDWCQKVFTVSYRAFSGQNV